MKTHTPHSASSTRAAAGSAALLASTSRSSRFPVVAFLSSLAALALSGCATTETTAMADIPAAPSSQILHPGDVVKISFPRTATLDTTQQIRRDGKINLYLIGEVHAADLSPAELEKQLVEKYAKQVVSSEVLVTVVSSAFTVYVGGAVLHPGRIAPDRELTLMEALMEAGGFDPQRANLKAVSVMRREGAQTKNFVVNVQAAMQGQQGSTFYLQPNDIIYVPERRSIF